jgi:DNA-binding NtrC family response regulator
MGRESGSPDLSADARLVVLALSDSFNAFWPVVGREIGAALVPWHRADGEAFPSQAAAVVVAAGGREEELLELLPSLAVPADVPVIVVGALSSHRVAARAVAAGAADYFVLPGDRDGLRDALAAAVARRRAALGRVRLGSSEGVVHAFQEIVGESPLLKATLEQAARILPHHSGTILVTGQTGTGKELLARALHYGGPRASGPFVELNCAALPPQLLESELFGHERGAFTDARTAKPGLFEIAEGGTLFLDEIQQLHLELQAKLLRVLEQKSVRRLGATTTRTFDVRIVAASNADLAAEVEAGRFREDLYYRVSVIRLHLPPLRERGTDVLLLAESLLRRLCAQYRLPEPAIGQDVRRVLLGHSWPGNVRELRNAIERALLLSPPGTLAIDRLITPAPRAASGFDGVPLASLAEMQISAVRSTLEAAGGNRSEAARRLGISRARLRRLLAGGADDEEQDGAADDTTPTSVGRFGPGRHVPNDYSSTG